MGELPEAIEQLNEALRLSPYNAKAHDDLGVALVDSHQILQAIEKLRITCLIAVPSQYRLLTKDPTAADLSSIWLAIAGLKDWISLLSG